MSKEEEILLEKLAFLRYEHAKNADAGQKFALKKQIQEIENRLQEIRNQSSKNNSQHSQKSITMAEQAEPTTTEKQEEQTPWYKNKTLIAGIVTILSGVVISVISFIGNGKSDEKITTSSQTITSYIVEGIVRNQNNEPILNTKILANREEGFTDTQNGTFSIQGVKIGKSGKIEFFIKGETLLKDSSNYDIVGNKVQILQALRITIKDEETIIIPKPTYQKTFNISKPKINYHSITLQGDNSIVDYILFDHKRILPKDGTIKLPNLNSELKNIKIYFKDKSKEEYSLGINNQTENIAIK